MTFDEKFQVASFGAILIGFALIIWEFQQNRDMTAAMLASDGAIHRADLHMQIASYSEVYARACAEPDSLSLDDSIVLMRIYSALYESRINRVANYEAALGAGVDRSPSVNRFFRFMFETDFGRKHWSRIRASYDADFRAAGDEILGLMGAPYCFAQGGI